MKRLGLLYMLSVITNGIAAQAMCALVTFNDLSHGYIDENGNLLYKESNDLTLKEKIFSYKEGLGRIRRNGKFGFIDHKGDIKIPILYDKAEDFNEGLAEVEINGKWGYLNTKGEIAIQPQFETVHRFSCGLAAFGKHGKHGYINREGKVVITPIFDRVSHFKDNKAWVLLDGKWGCINKSGMFIIEPIYIDTFDFSDGYAWVKKNGQWGLIDSTNKIIIQPNERNNLIYAHSANVKNFASVTDGLLISKANNKTGYCELPSLKKIISSKFNEGIEFKDSLAIVFVDGNCGVIDTHGNYIIEPKYKEIKYLGNRKIFGVLQKGKEWGILNLISGEVNHPDFRNIYYFEPIL